MSLRLFIFLASFLGAPPGNAQTCSDFAPTVGFAVTARDAAGNATAGRLRILAPAGDVVIATPYGTEPFTRIAETPFAEAKLPKLSHGMAYRLTVAGKPYADPSATQVAPDGTAIFWDFDRPGAPRPAPAPVLAGRSPIIAEAEIYGLARKWPHAGAVGPAAKDLTYRFVADSGLIAELRRAGYTAVALLPLNSSAAGDRYTARYDTLSLFGPDPRYGTADDFVRMTDAFSRAGIAVIVDMVVDRRAGAASPYDLEDASVQRFIADAMLTMRCRFGVSGIRPIAAGAIPAALTGLVEAASPGLLTLAASAEPDAAFVDLVRANVTRRARDIDVLGLSSAARLARLDAVGSHADDAYLATLLAGGHPYYVEKKTMAFSSVALLAGAAYQDLPQERLLQTGSFKDDAAVDWSLKRSESTRRVYDYFAALATFAGRLGGASRALRADTTAGRRIAVVERRSADGAHRYVAVVNLSHVGQANYAFGVDRAHAYKVVLNADAPAYGGSGVLERRLASGFVVADGPAMDGKEASVMIPFLGPYATVVLEQQ